MNTFVVIANAPLDVNGEHYETGDSLILESNACAPLLVLGRVRLTTTPAPPPAKRPRGRPRKVRTEDAPTYQRRDLQAEE